MIRLTVPGVPEAKGSYRSSPTRRVLTSMSSKHEASMKLWHDTVCAAAHRARPVETFGTEPAFPDGGVFVGAVFGFPVAERHFDRHGRLRADTPWLISRRARGVKDGDKCERLLLDSLTDSGRIWRDDVQAHTLIARVYLAPGQAVETTVLCGAAIDRYDVMNAWARLLGAAHVAMVDAIVADAKERNGAPARRGKKAA